MGKSEWKPGVKKALTSAGVGAAVFFFIGPWLVEESVDYGLKIFDPTLLEDLAVFAAGLMSFPIFPFVDSLPLSRSLMAINGALWGAGVYACCAAFVRLRQSTNRPT